MHFALPFHEKPDSLSLEARAKGRGMTKTEGRGLITRPDTGRGPKLSNSALPLIPARDHSEKPRSKTSNRRRKVQSRFCCHQTSATLDKALICLCQHLVPVQTMLSAVPPSSHWSVGPGALVAMAVGVQDLLLCLWAKPLALTGLNANFI